MSWSINFTSQNKESLKKAVQAEEYMPKKLKEMLCEQVDVQRLPEPKVTTVGTEAYAIRVASSGHHDSNYCYGDFKVELTRRIE